MGFLDVRVKEVVVGIEVLLIGKEEVGWFFRSKRIFFLGLFLKIFFI